MLKRLKKNKVADYSRLQSTGFKLMVVAAKYASHRCPVTLIILNATGQRWLAYLY